MSSMRTRTARWVALFALLGMTGTAFAKDTKKKDKAADSTPKGGMMEDSGKDPAETETTGDEGQFVPGKKAQTAPSSDSDSGDDNADESEESTVLKRAAPKKDEPAPPAPPPKVYKAKKTIGVFAELMLGFGKAPVPGPGDLTTGSATSLGLMIGGHYDLTPEFRLLLRVPWTTASFDGSSESALGNPELAARYRLSAPGPTEWDVRLGIGIPVAQGNPDITDTTDTPGTTQQATQNLANAAQGGHDPELFLVKRLPISPALLFTHRVDRFRFGADLKLVIAPKIGGSISQPNAVVGGTYEMKSLSMDAILGGSASYEVIDHLHVALAAWASYQIARPVDYSSGASGPSNFQLAVEPRVLAQFGHFVPSVGLVLPIGGELGGNIIGLRLHLDAVF